MRRIHLLAALGVATLGLLVAPVAFSSNMGFKLERNLDNVAGGQSFYLMSFPFYRSFGDLWDSGANALGSDGVVNSGDVLADWFTGGDGTCDSLFPSECDGKITLMSFDNNPASPTFNQFFFQTIEKDPFGGQPSMTGTPFDVEDLAEPHSGYMSQIVSGNFPVVIVGSHNPDETVMPMSAVAGGQAFYPFSLPYHTTEVTSEDVLQNAWDNRTTAGPPCPIKITILDFDNDTASATFNQFVGQTIEEDPFSPCTQSITGSAFNLVPGNGYLFQVIADGTDLSLPHY